MPLPNFHNVITVPGPPTPPHCARFHDCYLHDTLSFQPSGAYFDLFSVKEERERNNPSVRFANSLSLTRLEQLETYITELKGLDLHQVDLAE